MAPIRYSLHYEDYSEHLMSRFGKLLQMQSLVDMTLMCSSHTLRVHKAVLAASSAYFQDVLQKQTGEPLIILKMRFSVLKSLVEFMYCGKTQCLEENLDELVSAAQFLKIKGLAKVTKEGLGITNNTELPAFTPPVVINRPPQSILDLHTQENQDPQLPQPAMPATSVGPPMPVDNMGRSNKGGVNPGMEYAEPTRTIKPRRGRPSQRTGWETTGPLSRAAERALMRREQDSRKAIHQLKHLQSRYNQDYMDRVTLSQAVSSICGPETPNSSYMNMDTDFMYMDQSSSVLNPYKEPTLGEPMAASYSTPSTSTGEPPINNAMSQYVNALKSAGLPTDLPILFESGDGSYINVNEQVLLDMVQSSEIQYEVIEQPNIIENVANPTEIKSIDDLSKSIERGEMMINKDYPSTSYDKDPQYSRHEDAINSLNAILPDNLDSYGEQQNFVVLDPRMQESNNAMDHVNTDFSCIDGDMQFFTKSMSDDVKKYYVSQQLEESRAMEMCQTSSSLDTFSMSLLGTKSALDSSNMSQQFSSLHSEDLRRNEDCYDFGLQLSQSADDALECLINKQNDKDRLYSDNMENADKAREEIIKDLMSIETNLTKNAEKDPGQNEITDNVTTANNEQRYANDSLDDVFEGENNEPEPQTNTAGDITAITTEAGIIQWDSIDLTNRDNVPVEYDGQNVNQFDPPGLEYNNRSPVIDLTKSMEIKEGKWAARSEDAVIANKENLTDNSKVDNEESTLEDDIPFAVGLLPLKQIQPTDDNSLLKRKSLDMGIMDHEDAKCLKRKVKYKI